MRLLCRRTFFFILENCRHLHVQQTHTAISKSCFGVCACVRLTGTRILLEWPVSFSHSVSVLECAFLVAVFDVCMCRGLGGGPDSSLLTAKTTASSDTAPAPVCLPCWPLVKSGQRLHGSAAVSADRGTMEWGTMAPGSGPVWSYGTTSR